MAEAQKQEDAIPGDSSNPSHFGYMEQYVNGSWQYVTLSTSTNYYNDIYPYPSTPDAKWQFQGTYSTSFYDCREP
jgi:hypothetical protein